MLIQFCLTASPQLQRVNVSFLARAAIARITDVTGRILTENFIIQANQVTNFDVSTLSTGFYFLESIDGDTIFRERFVVEN